MNIQGNQSAVIVRQGQIKGPAGQLYGQRSNKLVKAMGVVILLIQFGLLWAYGFAANLLNQTNAWGGLNSGNVQAALIFTGYGYIYYFAALIFALIGFGCLFGSLSRSTLSGFLISFLIIGFTTLLSPMLQKFWFNIFTGSFSGDYQLINTNTSGLMDYVFYLSGTTVWISYFILRISLLNAISQLVVMYGCFQKLNVGQMFLFSLLYQIAWTLNFHLNAELAFFQPDPFQRLFDDYAINQVFLFASIVSIIICVMNKRQPAAELRIGQVYTRRNLGYGQVEPIRTHWEILRAQTQMPLIISLIGTFLLFLTFMAISLTFPVKSAVTRYIWSQAWTNILLALSACVFTTMFISTMLMGVMPIRPIHYGIIGGAILAGPIAGTLTNIGAMIAIGTVAGIINSIYYHFLHPKLNLYSIFDIYGATYIFVISLIGVFFIQPIVLVGMWWNKIQSNLLNNVVLQSINSSGWSLVYLGISFGIALVAGLIIGAIMRLTSTLERIEFNDITFFDTRSGLNDRATRAVVSQLQGNQTAEQLRRPTDSHVII